MTKEKCELCKENNSEMDFTAITAIGIMSASICLSCWEEYPEDYEVLRKLLRKRKDALPDVFDWLEELPTEGTINEIYGEDKADEVLIYLRTGKTEAW